MTTTTVVDIEEVTAIVRRHRELGEVIADLAQQRDDLKARFEAIVPVGFTAEIDGKEAYRRDPNRRFDLNTAVKLCQALGYQVKQYWEYDADDAKALLKAAGRYDDAMLPGVGANRVSL